MSERMTWARVRDNVFPSWAEEMARYGFDTRGWALGNQPDGWGLYQRDANGTYGRTVRTFNNPREAEEFLNGMRTAMRYTVDPQPVGDGGKYRAAEVDHLDPAETYSVKVYSRAAQRRGKDETHHLNIDARQLRVIRGVLAQDRVDEK